MEAENGEIRSAEKGGNRMKKLFVTLLMTLCLLAFVFALSSCGEKGTNTTTAGESAPDQTSDGSQEASLTEVATTDKWVQIAPKVTIINPKLRTFRIEMNTWGNATKINRNRELIAGPDGIQDGVTPVIQQMIYERNRAADDLLDTTVEYVFWDDLAWADQAAEIIKVVEGNAADAPDLFIDGAYDLTKTLLTTGAFKDLWTIPGSFFDFDSAGWMKEWMDSMSLTGDRAYILGGDYFVDLIRSISVLPFNVDLMNANGAKLAPAIMEEGETLGETEDLSVYFFDQVEQGCWTWETLGKLCEAIWVDTDGNGQDSLADTLGILGFTTRAVSSAIYCYSNDEQFFDERPIDNPNSKYNEKNWVYYPDSIGALGEIFDAVTAVYRGHGSLATGGETSGNTPDNPGLAYHWVKFGQGETLFAGACLLGTLEDEAFQQMRDLYSVVPIPKVHAESRYNSMIFYDNADTGAINVNTHALRTKVITAYLQYSVECSTGIRTEFLQTVMKYKTTVYNQGTDRMLELIYASVISSRDKVIEYEVGGDVKWNEEMQKGEFVVTSADLASIYEANYRSKQARLDQIIRTWYSHPKVEAGE